MAINLIHISDIHFGSGESHGSLNPQTGLNIRFEDFVEALRKAVQYAIDEKIDVFLFSGDAYKNASPEPIYQKMFAQELKRLSDAGIKTILVVGNHDQILRATGSHSMSVFQSLEVPGVIIIDKPMSIKLDTRNGAFQLVGLPHVNRNQLVTLEKYGNVSASQIDRVLVEHITEILSAFYGELDSSLPTVVTAHMTVDRALAGIEQELLVGYTQTFPTDIFVHRNIDYVALGHVHKHQQVRPSDPPIVYAGSLERVDFGEEREDKGFVHVKLARNNTSFEFKSINPRPFLTVELDVVAKEDPLAAICKKIAEAIIPGCVLRVRYKLSQEQATSIDENQIRKACQSALSVRLQPEVVPTASRARLPQLNESQAASPMVALETYLDEFAPERKETLIKLAGEIMNEVAAKFQGNE
ncbi:MAG: exonuclease sbcCD subunit D [Candidatus Melainabacteria bacterium]|nr:MAG: exonuclease sbcCD subunit D [Candidatus Melainabacteria bacterium]